MDTPEEPKEEEPEQVEKKEAPVITSESSNPEDLQVAFSPKQVLPKVAEPFTATSHQEDEEVDQPVHTEEEESYHASQPAESPISTPVKETMRARSPVRPPKQAAPKTVMKKAAPSNSATLSEEAQSVLEILE